MLTEKQDMVTITTWLLRWLQTRAQNPKEVVFWKSSYFYEQHIYINFDLLQVCDSSRALLSACCLAFASLSTVEAYADACKSTNVPRKIGLIFLRTKKNL